jgi:hypothetical protein
MERTSKSTEKSAISPDKIEVILVGLPDQQAMEAAKACLQRGYKLSKVGLTMGDHKTVDIPEFGQISLTNIKNEGSKSILEQAIAESQKNGLTPIVADTTNNVNGTVKMYTELKIPFVMQSQEAQFRNLVQEVEEAKMFALISEDMNKQTAAFDAMWEDWSKRFPGLFADYDFDTKTNDHKRSITESMIKAFNDLFHKTFTSDYFHRNKAEPIVGGHVTREYMFKNSSGTSNFTFSHTCDNEKEFAEGIAEGVGFLAQKTHQMAETPQVFGILDVAEQGLLSWA